MRKILLFCCTIILLFKGNIFAFPEDKGGKNKTFAEIILGDYLKDSSIYEMNQLIEDVEATLDINQLRLIENLLKEKIEKKTQPEFLYYYFLARNYINFANLYEQTQDKENIKRYLEEALSLSRKSIEHKKDFSDTHRLLSDIYGRLIPLKNPAIYGMLYGPRANKEVELAIKLNPQNPEAYLSRGTSYFFTPVVFGGNKKKALEYFEKAVSVCPDYYMSYMWIGIWYLKRGEKDKAKWYFKKSLELKPNFGWAIYELKRLEN